MPAAPIRDSRWVRNGSPAVGNIGLGADRVNGRSRVPLPPTRTTASTCFDISAAPPHRFGPLAAARLGVPPLHRRRRVISALLQNCAPSAATALPVRPGGPAA